MHATAQSSQAFFRRVILPLAALVAMLMMSAAGGTFWIANYQTEVAIAQQVRLARGALRLYGDKLAMSAADYGYWDDAVAAIVDKYDPVWISDNIGGGAEKSLGVAMAFALDPQGRALYSRIGGVDGREDPARFFPDGFRQAHAAWRRLPPDRSYSGIVPYGNSAALIAIAPVRAWNDAKRPPTGYSLLFVQLLEGSMLEALARDYELQNLLIAHSDGDVTDARATLSIDDGAGRMVSRLAWVPVRPGDELLGIALPFITFFLVALSTLGAFVMRHAFQSAQLITDREKQAFRDPLTGLANRALFFAEAEKRTRRARDGSRITVMYLDLDGFKPVNDTMGHAAGDVLLQEVARRLLDCIDNGDLAARLGGDEFAILLREGRSQGEIEAYAEGIRAQIAMPFPLPAGPVFISCSIGIATRGDPSEAAFDLVNRADRALYRAKAAGRNRAVFDDEADMPASLAAAS
jgi:diguanylate cyclase (GGDEF)-like protein